MMKEHSDITLQIIMNEFIELADSLAKCEHKTFSPPFQSYEEGNIDILDHCCPVKVPDDYYKV